MKVEMKDGLPLSSDDTKDRVLIGRNADGLIFTAMPPGPFAITFMLLAQDHSSINCAMVDSMAYHMQTQAVADAMVVAPEILKIILTNLKNRHGTEFTDSVWKQGDSEILGEGIFYAELHPIDLAAISQSCKELQATISGNPLYPSISNVVELWIDAGARFVSSQELIASVGYEGKA